MKTFRLVLTLLLCLSVPVAGWASVMSGPLCPQLHHQHASVEHDLAPVASAAAHHHEHCGDVSTHDTPCKGDHCACGCGVGACSSSQLPLLTLQSLSFVPLHGQQRLPELRESIFVGTSTSSPLRPPIS